MTFHLRLCGKSTATITDHAVNLLHVEKSQSSKHLVKVLGDTNVVITCFLQSSACAEKGNVLSSLLVAA